MIENLKDLEDLVLKQLISQQINVQRIKRTVEKNSIYIYINKGAIRLSDHHNQNSFEKCISSILIPIKGEHAIKMIKVLFD